MADDRLQRQASAGKLEGRRAGGRRAGWEVQPARVLSADQGQRARLPVAMTAESSHPEKLRVVVAGGGVAALETVLALADLASDQTDVTVLAPGSEFVYRPMTVREPFAY